MQVMAKNHFGGYLSKSWYILGGKSCSQTRKSCFQEGNPVFKKGNPAVKKGIPAFKKGNPAFNKAKPRFNKARPRFNKAWGTSQEQVRFWDPFSEKICENPSVLHGLGAARRSEADEADEPDEPDEGKMVHDRQFGP